MSRHANHGRRIDSCVDCGTALPLGESPDPAESRTWLCGGCGREYRGQLVQDYSLETLRNIRPEPVIFDRSRIPTPSTHLLEAARRLQPVPHSEFRDKRQSIRYDVSTFVATQTYDKFLRPLDPPVILVTRNISQGGICLLSDRALRATFLGLEISGLGGDFFQVLAQVMRSRPKCSLHEVGCEFLCRMASSTSRVMR